MMQLRLWIGVLCVMVATPAFAQSSVVLGYEAQAVGIASAQLPTVEAFAQSAIATNKIVVITSHATAADAAAAMQLSANRSLMVRAALVHYGMSAINIKMVNHGNQMQKNEVLLSAN